MSSLNGPFIFFIVNSAFQTNLTKFQTFTLATYFQLHFNPHELTSSNFLKCCQNVYILRVENLRLSAARLSAESSGLWSKLSDCWVNFLLTTESFRQKKWNKKINSDFRNLSRIIVENVLSSHFFIDQGPQQHFRHVKIFELVSKFQNTEKSAGYILLLTYILASLAGWFAFAKFLQ